MNQRTPRSLIALTIAMTLPFVILTILAISGIKAQRDAALLKARKEARLTSASQGQFLALRLNAMIDEVPQFDLLPLPHVLTDDDQTLDGENLEALKELRDTSSAGFNPSGLPRRALAALRIDALYPKEQTRDELVKILTEGAPSLLTVSMLRKIQQKDLGFTIPVAWQLVAALDEVNASYPEGGWVTIAGEKWWLSADGRKFLPPLALNSDEFKVPPFAEIRISSDTGILTGSSRGEVLAKTEIDFPSPLFLEWVLTSPAQITAPINRLVYWAAALLGSSLLVSGIGLYAIVRSIKREQRLNQLKSQFISSVSHELRTPVGSIRLVAETLETGQVSDPGSSYQLIAKESKRLSHLIENVLNFSRIEEGKYDYHFEDSDLPLLIQDALEILSPRVLESNHTLDLSLEACEASVDPQALQQAVINLVDNGLKFSPPATVVKISLTSNESHWFLAITNEGAGIPDSEHRRIFERFYRLGDGLRRDTPGSGIGLNIVQQIVEDHKGRIKVTSVLEGPTTFTLSAPLSPRPVL